MDCILCKVCICNIGYLRNIAIIIFYLHLNLPIKLFLYFTTSCLISFLSMAERKTTDEGQNFRPQLFVYLDDQIH